jgi:hypothetical protein
MTADVFGGRYLREVGNAWLLETENLYWQFYGDSLLNTSSTHGHFKILPRGYSAAKRSMRDIEKAREAFAQPTRDGVCWLCA